MINEAVRRSVPDSILGVGVKLSFVDDWLILESLVLTAGYAGAGFDVVLTHTKQAGVAVQLH